jgi:signal peptidase I
MDNLNYYLYGATILLTLVEAVFKWVIPSIRKNPQMAGTVETVDSLWVALVVALSLKAVLVQPFTIPSGSMEDTLLVGDYILVKKYEYGYSIWNSTNRFFEFRKPQHRDIVVFVYPGDHTKDFIKRCIGLPGDVLEMKNKDLYVNGVKQDEPYVKHVDYITYPRGTQSVDRDNFGPVTVDAGHYFMMGDNRDNSMDSRYWGQLDEKLVKGRAWVIYWHSVGLPSFIILVGLGVAAVCLFLLLLDLARMRLGRIMKRAGPPVAADPSSPPGKTPNPAPTQDWGPTLRGYGLIILISCAVAGVILASTGIPAFQQNCQNLKDRMFMVIR